MAPKALDDDVSDKRLTIYPAYIDALKTVAEGRRIPKDKACPNPHVLEMRDAAQHLGLQCEPEDKAYPRDWLVRGRLRVSLFDDNDDKSVPLNPEITTRRELLVRLADLVRRHPSQIAKAAQRAAKGASSGSAQKQQSKEQGAKRKRGTVKACHVPILEEIAVAQQAMLSQGPPGSEAGPSGVGAGGGASGGGAGGGSGKSAKKKSAKKK